MTDGTALASALQEFTMWWEVGLKKKNNGPESVKVRRNF